MNKESELITEDMHKIANNYSKNATLYLKNFRYADALDNYKNALEIQEIVKSAPITIANTREKMGIVYIYRHKYEDALTNFIKALKIYKSQLGTTDTYTTNVYLHIGMAYENLMDKQKEIEHDC